MFFEGSYCCNILPHRVVTQTNDTRTHAPAVQIAAQANSIGVFTVSHLCMPSMRWDFCNKRVLRDGRLTILFSLNEGDSGFQGMEAGAISNTRWVCSLIWYHCRLLLILFFFRGLGGGLVGLRCLHQECWKPVWYSACVSFWVFRVLDYGTMFVTRSQCVGVRISACVMLLLLLWCWHSTFVKGNPSVWSQANTD